MHKIYFHAHQMCERSNHTENFDWFVDLDDTTHTCDGSDIIVRNNECIYPQPVVCFTTLNARCFLPEHQTKIIFQVKQHIHTVIMY
jgi:hypothetical protein